MREYKNIVFEKEEGIATITLNRPEILNPLDLDTMEEIGEAIEDIRLDEECESGDK
jgi:enoyl-CoA hydratase